MSRLFAIVALAAVSASTVLGTPLSLEAEAIGKRQSITTLSDAQVGSFKPFTFFASAAYCKPSTTINWNCGGNAYFFKLMALGSNRLVFPSIVNCEANQGFQPKASGGDGTDTQFC